MTDERRPDGDAHDPTAEAPSGTMQQTPTEAVAPSDETAPPEVLADPDETVAVTAPETSPAPGPTLESASAEPEEAEAEAEAAAAEVAAPEPAEPGTEPEPAEPGTEPEPAEPGTEPEPAEPEAAAPEVAEPEAIGPDPAEAEAEAASPESAEPVPSAPATEPSAPDAQTRPEPVDESVPVATGSPSDTIGRSDGDGSPRQTEPVQPSPDVPTPVAPDAPASEDAAGDTDSDASGDQHAPAPDDSTAPALDDTAVWTPQSWSRSPVPDPTAQDTATTSLDTASVAGPSTPVSASADRESRSGPADPAPVPARVSTRPSPPVPSAQPGPDPSPESGLPERTEPRSESSAHAAPVGHETAPGRDGSPMDVFPDERRPRRWHRVLGLVGAVLVVLGGAYVGAQWLWAERVPPGATVAGVEIGGLEADEAVARLDESLRAATSEPLPVAAGEKRTTLDPVAAGLVLDTDATVAQMTGFSLEPARLWHQVFGVGVVDPVTEVDGDALAAAVTVLEDSLVTPPVDGSVLFVDGTPQTTDAVAGTALDVDGTTGLLVDGWLTAPRPIDLPTLVTEPDITQAEVDETVATLAGPLARAPVAVAVGEQLAELPVDVVTSAATFVPHEGGLELVMDGAALVEAVVVRTTDLLISPADASFEFQDGVPVIVGGVQGTTLDPEQVGAAVAAAGTASDRTARVDLVEVDPEQTTAELEGLGVTTKVAEFSTPLTNDADRNHNLTLGASRVNGTLLRPDDVFSLTDTLAPITTAGGYRQAGVVVNGVLTQGTGGGLSQMGTTVYNAGFFAGLEDVEHRPHSYYFSRYPEGREATIYDGVLDVKLGNNTPYGVLLQSWVAGGRLHVAVWSTPYWTVEHSTSGRSGIVAPKTVYNTSAGCISQSAGNPGFQVTVTRRLLLEGEVQHEESNSWKYQPQNAIVCGPAPGSPEQPPAG
ncbi:VanW family protein [Actinotalea sp. K2]|uniref:VanW family protein n=1 Tax=Actinotalea sp. K2 TaxID=2939438 RepID=UPI002017C68D|nr:VanW family protein [Actinotalea sp. K2]MCL3862592.1 VanW family protein [Actinotalea sp. K2]